MRARDFRWLFAALVMAIACVVSPPASANVAQSSFEGDRSGLLVARSETVLRVDSEDLVFELEPTLETFAFEVPPGATKTVSIAYTHTPGMNLAKRVSTVFTYEYLLSPAKTWAAFGPLHIVVKLPPNTAAWSAMPWREEGSERRADFTTLPDGELVFEVMSTKGLWFGMAGHDGYWVIVIVALLAVAVAAGRVGGKMWGRGGTSGIASVGWAVAIMIVSGLGAIFACVVLTALFPPRALGFGYGSFFGLTLGVVVVCIVTPVIAAKTRTGVRRAAASPNDADAS